MVAENNKMNVMSYRQYGGPEQLTLSQEVIPKPASSEVLVKIHASTVNRTDCGFLRGEPWVVRLFSGLLKPRAQILGCEFAGEVVELDSSVSRFSVGDRVMGFKDDDHDFGGHAEYTLMPENAMIATIPEEVSYSKAASALEGAHYALHYIRPAKITATKSVLVNGASGAIGSAAVQIVKSLGARVVAVCGAENAIAISALGADRVIDYRQESFINCDETFDLVFDTVGNASLSKCQAILKNDGFYASTELGEYCQNPLLALYTKFVGKQTVLFPIPKNKQADAEYISKLMEDGHFSPLIDRTYELEDVPQAFEYVEKGMKTGNVVIQVIGK